MSLASNIHELLLGGGSTYSYTINNSLRFRSSASAYLSRTPGSAGNRQTWTWSGWVKLGNLGDSMLFCSQISSSDKVQLRVYNNNIVFLVRISGVETLLITTQVLRDPSSWYHIIAICDTTQSTSSNRAKLYLNGNLISSFSTATYTTQNGLSSVNYTVGHQIGYDLPNTVSALDGYLAEINFIDGLALDPSYFGATNSTTGTWAPKAYTGSYGTNGFYLPFRDTSGLTSGSNTGIGKDFSGNGNYWNTNNISLTAGSTYDAMLDSPTPNSTTVGNYAVLNPVAKGSNTTLQDANLTYSITASATNVVAEATIAMSSGQWYCEVIASSVDGHMIGIMSAAETLPSSYIGSTATSYAYSNGGSKYNNGSGVAYGASYGSGDIIGIAFDATAGSLTFYKNGTSQGTAYTGITAGQYVFATGNGRASGTTTQNWNFGQRPFAYTPPTGFKALQTYNLPTPAIKKGNQHFDVSLYTGNGSTQSITNSGFRPDFVWAKARSTGFSHGLFDSVRGTNNALRSNTTSAETNEVNTLTAFNSTGFTVGADATGLINYNGTTYVGWQWKSGGTAVTNTNGSISSQVSANPSAGFSVVTYTGNNTAGATVGHGLGVAPKMVITKTRGTISDWAVYHESVGPTAFLRLNTTAASQVASTVWNNTAPSSTVITLGTASAVNDANGMVAYCFAAIPGYSAFGSYTGNGSADGPFVFTGFLPKFVMIKIASGGTANWLVQDSARDAYNPEVYLLNPNLSDAEATSSGYAVDFVANGFKLRNATTAWNYSGATFIYAAFASNPFQYSLAR